MMNLEEAREYFKNDKFASAHAGIVIDEVGENYAACSMELGDIHRNADGGIMGGAIFTLCDFVFAVTTNRDPEHPTVTSVSQISYIAASRGSRLIGRSRMLKEGKRSCFYEIEVTDDLGKLIAVCSMYGTHL